MEAGGSILHSQGFSNNPYPELNQKVSHSDIYLRSILILSSHLHLNLPKGLFPVKFLKALLLSSILVT